jgi:hypothetical protein
MVVWGISDAEATQAATIYEAKMVEGCPPKYSSMYTIAVVMGNPEDVEADVAETFMSRLGTGEIFDKARAFVLFIAGGGNREYAGAFATEVLSVMSGKDSRALRYEIQNVYRAKFFEALWVTDIPAEAHKVARLYTLTYREVILGDGSSAEAHDIARLCVDALCEIVLAADVPRAVTDEIAYVYTEAFKDAISRGGTPGDVITFANNYTTTYVNSKIAGYSSVLAAMHAANACNGRQIVLSLRPRS